MSFNTRGPYVRSNDAPDEVWDQTGFDAALWSHVGHSLFWVDTVSTPRLLTTDFSSSPPESNEHLLSEPLSVRAVSPDDTHLLLTHASGQLYLFNGTDRQVLLSESTYSHSFATNGAVYAYTQANRLGVGRLGVDAPASNWLTSADLDRVDANFRWSQDSSVLVYRADRTSRGHQLFRVEVLRGKPSGQSVHAIRNCSGDDCPSVKAFRLEP
jgi:hypothetical protein